MTAIMCILICVCCLLGLLLFGCSAPACIIGIAVSAALFAFDMFLFKEARFKKILSPVLCCALVAACVCVPLGVTDYGYYDYRKMLESFGDSALSGKTDKTQKKLDELTSRYGETDDALYVLALKAIERGAPDEAESYAKSFTDRTSENYYTVMELAITAKHEFSDDLTDQLITLYESAAKDNPNWQHANKNLGMLLLDNKEYEKATYYLLKAYELAEEPDGEASYLLGVAMMEQGKTNEGLALFEQAVDIGVDDDYLADIARYADRTLADEETEAD